MPVECGYHEHKCRSFIADYLDIVTDPVGGGDYRKDEDPRVYVSQKTDRGPLSDDWRSEYCEAQEKHADDKHLMCAYKICRVEFRYWGMQTKIERFIHDIGEHFSLFRLLCSDTWNEVEK